MSAPAWLASIEVLVGEGWSVRLYRDKPGGITLRDLVDEHLPELLAAFRERDQLRDEIARLTEENERLRQTTALDVALAWNKEMDVIVTERDQLREENLSLSASFAVAHRERSDLIQQVEGLLGHLRIAAKRIDLLETNSGMAWECAQSYKDWRDALAALPPGALTKAEADG